MRNFLGGRGKDSSRITGLAGLAVTIESSGGLSQWQFAGTAVLVGGTNYFVNPNRLQGAHFYRAQVR